MGLSGMGKSTVSKLCKDIDAECPRDGLPPWGGERVGAFLDRPLSGEWPYLWLDATYLKQREGGRIVPPQGDNRRGVRTASARSSAFISAHQRPGGHRSDSRREQGQQALEGEAETFWSTFLKNLVRRGLSGVKLVISDAHEGLKAAIRRVFRASIQGLLALSPPEIG